jgi:hypothetical protein
MMEAVSTTVNDGQFQGIAPMIEVISAYET